MNINGKRVLVTGVSGTVGDRIAARFVREGASVTGLIRDVNHVSLLKKLNVEPVFGDLSDKSSIGAALEDVDYVVHAAAYLGNDWDLAKATNILGVKNLAEEALSAGVERFIHVSTLSVYGEPKASQVDESNPMASDHPEPYVFTKAESERILSSAMDKGLTCVILRPGAICAEQNSHWGDKQVERMKQVDTVTWLHPEDMIPWVHAENLAEMCMISCTNPNAVNQIYHAIDGNYRESDFRLKIAQAMGKSFQIPDREPERTIYVCDKIRAELGYRPVRSFEETVSALIRASAFQIF